MTSTVMFCLCSIFSIVAGIVLCAGYFKFLSDYFLSIAGAHKDRTCVVVSIICSTIITVLLICFFFVLSVK